MTEILCPAGSLQKLEVAFLYGADACYLSGYDFSLRAGSANFSPGELKQAIDLAKRLNKKIYITVNSYLPDDGFEGLDEYLELLNNLKPDGLIVADIGIMRRISENTDLDIHVSTQASVLNSKSAEFYKKLGATRIVTGRELSIEECARIKKDQDIEIEMFIHGALCMSYSGRCTLSNYLSGRDSNRGGCIQSCRKLYRLEDHEREYSEYFLSSKDLNGLSRLKDMIVTGINSAKIEGRMKSLLYISTVSHIYSTAKKLLTKNPEIEFEELNAELSRMPFRGYTLGGLDRMPGFDSVYRGDEHEDSSHVMAGYIADSPSRNSSVFYATHKIVRGQKIRFLLPEKGAHDFTVDFVRNLDGAKVEEIIPNNLYLLEGEELQKGLVAGMVLNNI